MPIFGFKKDKKGKKVPKKASSMNNIYHDYSGTTKLQDVEGVEEHQDPNTSQFRGILEILFSINTWIKSFINC